MEDKITCPICKATNDIDEICCTECGQRFKPIELDTITCPICKTINDKSVDCCTSCGQRLRKAEIDVVKYSNIDIGDSVDIIESKEKKQSKLPFILLIIFAVIGFVFYVNKIQEDKAAAIMRDFKETTITINQNQQFTLPTEIVAAMGNNRRKQVDVQWDTKTIDTSSPGTKTATGKISGYDKTVKLKVIVLPQKIINTIADCTVQNSILGVNVKISADIKQVLFKVYRNGSTVKQVLNVDKGIINGNVYLPLGPGYYDVTVYTSKDTDDDYFYYYNRIVVNNEDARDSHFLLPDAYIDSTSPEILELAYSLTAGCHTDLERTFAIHDWVAKNISYDVKTYFDKKLHAYSSLETLKERTALCNGYASLTAALNRAIGIKAKYVYGTSKNSSGSESHAWNETYVDGKWIIQDTTWDAGGIDEKTHQFIYKYSRRYFDPDPEEFKKDHTKEGEL